MRFLRSGLGLASLALSLSGCIVLNSKAPLIAHSEAETGIAPGTWLSYPGFTPSQAKQLAPEARAKCFDSPWRVPALAPTGDPIPEAERGPLVYCPFDSNGQHAPSKPFSLRPGPNGFVAHAPEEKQDLVMRFERLNGDYLIGQLDLTTLKAKIGGGEADIGAFIYVLFRPHGGDLDLHLVPCDPGIESAAARQGAPRPAPRPPLHLKCTVKSLAAIRPDLLAYTASRDIAPIVILRRIGD